VPALDAAVYILGTAVAKTACGLWAGENKLVNELGNSTVDKVAALLSGGKQQRQFGRIWTDAAEAVADKLSILIQAEFRDLEDNEIEAVVLAVGDTFRNASLSEEDLFKSDLDAGYLDRFLRMASPASAERALLSEGGTRLYDLILREAAAYTIEVARALPSASVNALAELLARSRQIGDDIEAVLERLPQLRVGADFERDYRQLVVNRLDRIELFGATVSESSRQYPLSVAYLSLTATEKKNSHDRMPEKSDEPQIDSTDGQTFSVEEILAVTNRIFIRGQAGLGKTTLLQWIAVNGARQGFPEDLKNWNGVIPFFIPLRRFAADRLPVPSQFLAEVGRHIADEMPEGWVQQQLRAGRAVVLVDGIDELTEDRRPEARSWISELIATFPQSRYIVTSRPGAVPAEWLGADHFRVVELEPMDRPAVTVFVDRWHKAMLEQTRTQSQKDELEGYKRRLLSAIDQSRHIRQLVAYPLLCALTCALHRDRRGQLPSSRMELYEVALHMLLERRDEERDIKALNSLSRTHKTLLLQDLAYWLIRNGQSDASKEEVLNKIDQKIKKMTRFTISSEDTYKILLERSGLVREPIVGRVDFVHRTFQEYLAAKEAVDEGDIRSLVLHAHLDQWQETIVMAAGHATEKGVKILVEGLLRRAYKRVAGEGRAALQLLALACLEVSAECPEVVREAVLDATSTLIPPQSLAYADMLARAGSLSLDLLMKSNPKEPALQAFTIRAIGRIGDPVAIGLLARYARVPASNVSNALAEAWENFDPELYAEEVLKDCAFHPDGSIRIRDAAHLEFLPKLKNVRIVNVASQSLGNTVDLSFVGGVPNIVSLSVPTSEDLSPLAGTALEHFSVSSPQAHSIDLSPLGEVPNLRSLMLIHRNFSNVGSLSKLSKLTCISATPELFHELSNLEEAPKVEIAIVSQCSADTDISFLARWAASVNEVRLIGEAPRDITALLHLKEITKLVLFFDNRLDCENLVKLKSLIRLELIAEPSRVNEVIHLISEFPRLRELELSTLGSGILNVEPLTEFPALKVQIAPGFGTEVVGAEFLRNFEKVE
jgi:hypothetical protein